MHVQADGGMPGALMFARFRPRPERIIMPDVCCDLLWTGERLWLTGPQDCARPSAAVGQEVQLVNLDPLAVGVWLGVPLLELTNRKILLNDVNADHALRLSEMFHAGVAAVLVKRGKGSSPAADPRAAAAAAALRQGHSVGDAAGMIGLSQRQMERLWLDWFGLSPRRYRRILRLRQAVKWARNGESLAEAALHAGYVDQSHFNRDVRKLSGVAPRALLPNVGNVQDALLNLREY
jgi:AraC-like DNA-binding protein